MSTDNPRKDEILRAKKNSDEHYSNYKSFYSRNNLPKASEFIYGSINALIYGIGLYYNKKLGRYQKIKNFLPELSRQYNDVDIMNDGFESAKILHANFHQDFLEKDSFDYHMVKVEMLLKKLTEIFDDLDLDD